MHHNWRDQMQGCRDAVFRVAARWAGTVLAELANDHNSRPGIRWQNITSNRHSTWVVYITDDILKRSPQIVLKESCFS